MEIITNRLLKKFILVLLTIVMVTNFIMPNYVYAKNFLTDTLANASGILLYLFGKIGDIIFSILQEQMVGEKNIKNAAGNFAIKYSPGLIFSNQVPMLDINFFDSTSEVKKNIIASHTEMDVEYTGNYDIDQLKILYNKEYDEDSFGDFAEDYKNIINNRINPENGEKFIEDDVYISHNTQEEPERIYIDMNGNRLNTQPGAGLYSQSIEIYFMVGENESKEYVYYEIVITQEFSSSGTRKSEHIMLIFLGKASTETGSFESTKNAIFKLLLGEIPDKNTYTVTGDYYSAKDGSWTIEMKPNGLVGRDMNSYTGILRKDNYKTVGLTRVSGRLQSTISTWYNALRTLVLVSLLSVLVYVGIQIILSSGSAQKQAKYKNMLKDWLVAVCMLFVLHYFMLFMITISEKLINIMSSNLNSVGNNGRDALMTAVRQNMGDSFFNNSGLNGPKESMGYAIMWLALVLLTFTFTFQYMKRVIYMAFLTMIAPMVALTYPLDKLKDGKAQAFGFWLKEYVFNCLIQPVHLLIYVVLIDSALSFAKENVLYSLITMAFLVPSEKIIKEMFGLKSSGPSGTLNAVATASIVTGLMNKLSNGRDKDKKNEKSNGVRTANKQNDKGSNKSLNAGKPLEKSTKGDNTSKPSESRNESQKTLSGKKETQQPSESGNKTKQPADGNGSSTSKGKTRGNTGDMQGTSNNEPYLAKVEFSRKTRIKRGMTAIGKKYFGKEAWKKRAKNAGKFAAKTPFAVAAGAVAVAANVADGDLFSNTKKAFGEIGGSAIAGYAVGGKVLDKGKEVKETYKKGSMRSRRIQ